MQVLGTMQVASSPYSASIPHSHYHSYYQLHPPGPQDHDLKRQYLALLPPQQIIEICLAFDIHVSPYIRSTVWPLDINAAIAGLQKPPQPPAEKPGTDDPLKDGEAAMDSLKSPPHTDPTPTVQDTDPTTEPRPPDKERSATPEHSKTPSVAANSTSTTTPAETSPSTSATAAEPPQPVSVTQPIPATQPAPATQSVPTTQPVSTIQPHYPHQPYGYAHPQYPISPYYAQPPGGYSYPYGAYATTYHPQPPATYPPQPPYNNMMPHPPQPQQLQDGVSPDDLPSYEEMIVEALTGCADPEGLAPKDLFTLMSSRYPLQSNFRPSASQALQKAFKRGRFEKSSNGKYRLNATWEGGNTTRRTTRRPQTQSSQSTTATSTSAPPFTHAPLVHHNHASTSSQPTGQQPYPAQPYGYPGYPPYPGYPTPPQPSTDPGTAPGASSSTADKAAPSGGNVDTDSDAYEAAQNILSAINFGSMYQLPPEEQQGEGDQFKEEQEAAGDQPGGNGVEQLLSHVQAMLASNAANAVSNSGSTGVAPTPAPPQTADDGSAENPRAELQAQLALLAAQLAELAQTEEPTPPIQVIPTPAPVPAAVLPQVHFVPPPLPVVAAAPPPIQASAHVLAMPSTPDVISDMPDPLPEEEESDDDDMEEII